MQQGLNLQKSGNRAKPQCLPNILNQTLENLKQHHIAVEQITADAAYSSGETLKYPEETGIDAWIPNFGQYRASREGFTYNKEKDQYECQRGNKAILIFKGERMDSKGYTKRISRIRSRTMEPVPGTLLNFMNMRRVNTRGIRQANKHILMTALAYNLQKYLRFITKKPIVKMAGMSVTKAIGLKNHKNGFHELIKCILSPSFPTEMNTSFLTRMP